MHDFGCAAVVACMLLPHIASPVYTAQESGQSRMTFPAISISRIKLRRGWAPTIGACGYCLFLFLLNLPMVSPPSWQLRTSRMTDTLDHSLL